MDDDRAQFLALYLTRFAAGFGFTTLLTLLPYFIEALDPSSLEIGLFTTGLTIAQTVAVIPLAYAGDRYDKRGVLLGSLVVSVGAYVGFILVDTSTHFILARGLQGLAITGTGLMTLSLVGELSPLDERANRIGTANAFRFAAAVLGSVAAGGLYERFGFDTVFTLLLVILLPALVGVWLFVDRDETTVEGFAFTDLAVNDRIVTLSSFRMQYAVAVTMVRTWVPIYAGLAAARGGLAMGGLAVGIVVATEKFTNMLFQPHTGRLSDRFGRARFVAFGGAAYGVVGLAVPLAPAIAGGLAVPGGVPVLSGFPPVFFALVGLNALLGIADSFREPASMALFADQGTEDGGVASSFGIRELVWRPGSMLGPMLGGYLMTQVGMEWVFYVGAATALTGVAAFLLVGTHLFDRGYLSTW
ncbi:MAG: MFS family permease [Halobacteriales archaeon]